MTLQPLQDRVLTVLTEKRSVRVKELSQWLPDADTIALDYAMTALMRANRVSRVMGCYEIIGANGQIHTPTEPEPIAPPEAAQEAAAALREATGYCLTCDTSKPDKAFQHSKKGARYKTCIECAQKASRRGMEAAKARKAEFAAQKVKAAFSEQTGKINGGSGESSAAAKRLPDGAKPSPTPDKPLRLERRREIRSPEGECPAGTMSEPVIDAPQGNAGESLPSNSTWDAEWYRRAYAIPDPDIDYINRGEVMKTPVSAALGTEAGHLDTPQCDGTGAVPGREAMGTEAQAAQPSAAPITLPTDPIFAAILERFEALMSQWRKLEESADKAMGDAHEFAGALHKLDLHVREELGLEDDE